MGQEIDFEQERKGLTAWAWRTTFGYCILLSLLALLVVFGDEGFDAFREMKPNEVGDLLAGIAGPLAFIWLVYGYFLQGIAIRQQGEELRQNTKMLELQKDALREQVNELRDSVSQQTQLVNLNKEQLELEREKIKAERDYLRASMSPALVVSAVDPDAASFGRSKSHIQGDKKIRIKILNKGGLAHDVLIIPQDARIKCEEDAIQVVDKGSVWEIPLLIERGHELQEVELQLVYFDAFHERHERSYYLSAFEESNERYSYKLKDRKSLRADN